MADEHVVELSPYPSSRVRASGLVGYSRSAGRVLVVIAYRDLDGELHGMNGWPASGGDLATYRGRRSMMTRKLDEQTARAVREDARALEADADATGPYPPGTRIRRPSRASRMFNLRLTEEQLTELQSVARERHLPASTMARAWLLERLDRERHAS